MLFLAGEIPLTIDGELRALVAHTILGFCCRASYARSSHRISVINHNIVIFFTYWVDEFTFPLIR